MATLSEYQKVKSYQIFEDLTALFTIDEKVNRLCAEGKAACGRKRRGQGKAYWYGKSGRPIGRL